MARRIIKDMTVNEVSTVDRPAQKGATMAIMKRDTSTTVEKRTNLTTVTDGHQHALRDDYGNGDVNSGETDYVDGHSHPWVRDPSGNLIIGMARGHTHELGTIGKGDTTMKITNRAELTAAIATAVAKGAELTVAEVTTIQKAAADLKAEDALPAEGPLAKSAPAVDPALAARVERMEKRDALSADLRKHYDSLDTDEDRDAFLAKSETDQKAELTKSAGDDPVVYTTLDGIELRKSADPALVAMAKSADNARREAALEKARREDVELTKRAKDELGNVGGDDAGKKALLKAVDAIENKEAREAAEAVLKAANSAASSALTRRGSSGGGALTEGGELEKAAAESKLDDLAKAHAKVNNVSFEKAYSAVIETEEGQKLYQQVIA